MTSEEPLDPILDTTLSKQESTVSTTPVPQTCDCTKDTSLNKEADAINRFILISEDGNKLRVTTIKIPVDAELSSAVVQESVTNQDPNADNRQAVSIVSAERVTVNPKLEESKPEEISSEKHAEPVAASEEPKTVERDIEQKEPDQEIKKETPEVKKQKKQKKEGKRSKRDIKLKTKSKESWKNKVNVEKKDKNKSRK